MSISYPSFYNGSNQFIAQGSIQVRVVLGVFTVSLEPGNYYSVSYVTVPSGCGPPQENWNVPVSGSPVNLATVRTLSTPTPGLVSALPACSSVYLGSLRTVTDSAVVTWGSTVAGSGANSVMVFCNGTNWTVAAK